MPDRREFLGAVAGAVAGAMVPAAKPMTICGVPVSFDGPLVPADDFTSLRVLAWQTTSVDGQPVSDRRWMAWVQVDDEPKPRLVDMTGERFSFGGFSIDLDDNGGVTFTLDNRDGRERDVTFYPGHFWPSGHNYYSRYVEPCDPYLTYIDTEAVDKSAGNVHAG